jgi:hypothetical protein
MKLFAGRSIFFQYLGGIQARSTSINDLQQYAAMRLQSDVLPVNQEQTHILFNIEWREVLHDQEGAFYFLYKSSAVYVTISYYPPYRGKIHLK